MHWADGGPTKLNNLVLLCRRHHRRVHEDGWRVCSDTSGRQVVFFTPTGKTLAAAPPMSARTRHHASQHHALADRASERDRAAQPDRTAERAGPGETECDRATHRSASPRHRPPSPLERLTRALAERGVEPDWQTNLPRYRYDHEIPWALEAAAREALEAAAREALEAAASDALDGAASEVLEAAEDR